ncbi:MAG: hypothetical protein ACR2HF_13690 [Methylococcaceae bacterium]
MPTRLVSTTYDGFLATVLSMPRFASLGPGTPTEAAYPHLSGMTLEQIFPCQPIVHRNLATACLSGLWLYHNYLDESHRLSQSIHDRTGSFWHAIMHRREPDAWNSKYWFDRINQHPEYEALHAEVQLLASQQGQTLPQEAGFLCKQAGWNPHGFVDLCEATRLGRVNAEALSLNIQEIEWKLLFAYCYLGAVKPSD